MVAEYRVGAKRKGGGSGGPVPDNVVAFAADEEKAEGIRKAEPPAGVASRSGG
jgi:hypothetical protein